VAGGEIGGLSHIQHERRGAIERGPIGQRHVATQHVLGEHAGEVDRVFGGAELRRVAELGFGEIVHGPVELDGRRDDVDALLHALESDRLRPEEAAVGDREQELEVIGRAPG